MRASGDVCANERGANEEMCPGGSRVQTLRSVLLAGVAVLGLCAASPSVDAAQAPQDRVELRIPAQSLAGALIELGAQARVTVLAPDSLTAGRVSGAVTGSVPLDEALRRLLAGTGLSHEFVDARTVRVFAPDRGAALVPPPKLAQGQVKYRPLAMPTEQPPEEVVVTGTRIRGALPAAPVHVISRAEIDQSGFSQVGDLIRALPENFSGGQNPGVQFGAGGTNQNLTNVSTVNLRGLGTDATLVLLNGHRLAADGYQQGVDISGIPMAALERVEIVTDGSSALYGSDAVAGVANFILRKNYDGAEVSARLGGATQGGGFETTYGGLAGAVWSTGHALLNVEYSHQNSVKTGQRDFTSQAVPINSLLQASQRKSVFLNAEQNLTDWASVHFDGLYSDRQSGAVSQSAPTSSLSWGRITVDSYLLAPGVTFQLPHEWTASVEGLLSDGRDAQNVFTGATPIIQRYRNAVKSVDVSGAGPLFELPSGRIQAAIGASYRTERFNAHRDGVTTVATQDKTHDVRAVFGELSVPLVSPATDRIALQRLELSLAGRFEEYSDFGTTSNPKVGLRYVPVEGLTLRSTWGRSFKAPTFNQATTTHQAYLYNATSVGSTSTGTVLFNYGGNQDLVPERSKSWTAGFDWRPATMPSLDISATYFNINYSDRVVQPITAFGAALSNPSFAPFITPNPSAAQQAAVVNAVTRFNNITSRPYDPANVIALIEDRYVNANSQDVRGIDLSIRKSFQVASGTLDLFGNGSWLELKQRTSSTNPSARLSGLLFQPPRLRVRSGATWTDGGFTVTGIANYTSGETDTNITPTAHIASWTTFDMNVTWQLPASGMLGEMDLSFSVQNLLDRDPPSARGTAVQYPGIYYDSTTTSAIGRFVALTLRKKI